MFPLECASCLWFGSKDRRYAGLIEQGTSTVMMVVQGESLRRGGGLIVVVRGFVVRGMECVVEIGCSCSSDFSSEACDGILVSVLSVSI